MRLFRANLYVKIVLWMLLNIVLLAMLGGGVACWALMGRGYDGILPASLFSAKADRALRVVSANLQYRSALQWEELLKPHIDRLPVRLHMQTLDTGSVIDKSIPEKMTTQARALPRATYTFCPEPEVMFWDPMGSSFFAEGALNAEYGLPPVPPALFHHDSETGNWWLGRVMYIPDRNRQIHTLLVALESDRMDGYGFFFELYLFLIFLLGVFGISFLWWLPFVRHLSRPLRRMAQYAEEVEADNFTNVSRDFLKNDEFSGKRIDEVGRLGHALVSLTRCVNRMVTGQSQFIRYVAHELNTPLAKAQMGLGVLECRLEGDNRARVEQISGHIDRLSVLTDEVLSYLHAKAAMGTPQETLIDLCSFLSSLVQSDAPDEDVHVEVSPGLHLYADRDYLHRAMKQLLRNALHYARDAGPVVIRAVMSEHREICISVSDLGPGVPKEDMPLLMEPFFRGRAAATHPGGTGLGLSIVKYCTDACGGRVTYGNREKRGFEVRLYFPMKRRER